MDGLVAYDVLDNERRKAIAKLRKIPDVAESSYTYDEHLAMIYDALDVDAAPWSYSDLDEIRDNLIHLLGGDQPSGIDVLREMDEREADGRITDELRECVDTAAKSYDNTPWYDMDDGEEADHTTCHITEGELMRIADRIDEQFGRICQQQEAVLQSTISEVVDERDHWHQEAIDLMNRADVMERQRDELRDDRDKMMRQYSKLCVERADLLDLLRDAVVDFEYASYSWNYATIVGENITIEMERNRLAKERDELQAKLDKASGENKGLRLSIDEQKESIAQRKKTIKKLARDNEKVWKTVHELQAKLDAIRDALDG